MNSTLSLLRQPVFAALLMVTAASAVPAQVSSVSFKGAFDGKSTGTVEGAILRGTPTGAGTASYIGPFSYAEKAAVDLATGLSNGTFELVAAGGDTIRGSFVGRALPGIPKGSHYVALATITGGTGRYQGATGGFTVDRYFDDTNVPAYNLGYSSFKGTVDIPASAK